VLVQHTEVEGARLGAIPAGAQRREAVLRRVPGPLELDPTRFRRRRQLITRALSLGTPILLLLLWEVASQTRTIDPRFYPAPSAALGAGFKALGDGRLLGPMLFTGQKVLIGYSLGLLLGVTVGVTLAVAWLARAAFEPLIIGLYMVPKMAVFPILMLIFGLGSEPQVVLITLAVFFLITLSTLAGINGVPDGYLETARSFQATPWQIFRYVLLPGALPAITTAMRIAAGVCVLVVIGLEFVISSGGLGTVIFNAWQIFNPPLMYAGVILTSLFGLTFTAIITAIGRRLTPWTRHEDLIVR
jgi:ABC-type nitrate/sulfonate/bicarbonate transport system permease component